MRAIAAFIRDYIRLMRGKPLQAVTRQAPPRKQVRGASVEKAEFSLKGSKITIEIGCDDAYQAVVLFDELHDTLVAGGPIVLRVTGTITGSRVG